MRLRGVMFVLLLAGGVLLAACGQQPITAEEIVQRMEATRDSTRDAHATVAFSFEADGESGRLVVEGWLKKTDRTNDDGTPIAKIRGVVLEADKAELVGVLVVSDGETFWFYSPAEGKAVTGSVAEMKARQDDALSAPTDPLNATRALQDVIQEGLDAVDIQVLGEEPVAGRNSWKLSLTPKVETQQQLQLAAAVQATMWVDADPERAIPLKLDVDAADMGKGAIEVRSIELNTGLADDLFTFTPPAGTEVQQAADLAAKMKPRTATLDEARAAVDFPLLTPADPPQGATLVEVRLLGDATVIQNYSGGALNFSVVQSRDAVGAERQPPAGSAVEQVTVRGQPATLITSATGQGSLLRWEENGVRCIVAGALSAEDAMGVAESLK